MNLRSARALMHLGIVAKHRWPAIHLDGLHVIFASWGCNSVLVRIPVGSQHAFIGDPEDVPEREQRFEKECIQRQHLFMDGETYGMGYGSVTNTVVLWMRDGKQAVGDGN